MKTTQPSRSMPFDIYLKENDSCILSVDWQNGNNSYYLINDKGEIVKSENIKYNAIDEEPEDYYMDYLSADTIRKILVLTTVFSNETIVLAFEQYKGYFACDDVNYVDFDLPHAYMFSDYIDFLKQMFEYTGEDSYQLKVKESEDFFSTYFYDFSGSIWSEDDKYKIKTFFQSAIDFLMKNKEQ
jgi:hypothetical protein